MSESRILMNFQPLPPRPKTLDRETADTDIRDAIAKSEARLRDMALRYGTIGWTPDTTYGVEGYEFGLQTHTIIGRLRLVRP